MGAIWEVIWVEDWGGRGRWASGVMLSGGPGGDFWGIWGPQSEIINNYMSKGNYVNFWQGLLRCSQDVLFKNATSVADRTKFSRRLPRRIEYVVPYVGRAATG